MRHHNIDLITSEYVSMGHPDKLADIIADSILDGYLTQDPFSRIGCEVFLGHGFAVIAGGVASSARIDIDYIVRKTIQDVGYTNSSFGIDYLTVAVLCLLNKQSSGLGAALSGGSRTQYIRNTNDQGAFIGFAIDETPELMPLPITIARNLVFELDSSRKKEKIKYLRPDAKTQVTVEYENKIPKRVDTVIVSTQHSPEVNYDKIKEDILGKVIKKVVPPKYLDDKTKYYINPKGRFVVGGPLGGDVGVTGHNIVRNTYGGFCRINGGSFVGKDPSKIDRSAPYAARYLAKNLVAAKIAKACEVHLSYSIGINHPISIWVDTNGTGIVSDYEIAKGISTIIDLSPSGIISRFNLFRPIYSWTAKYGQVGIELEYFLWEKTDLVQDLLKVF